MTRIFEGLQYVPVRRLERTIKDYRYDKVVPGDEADEINIIRGNEHQEIRWEAIFLSAEGLPEMKQTMITLDAEPPAKRAWNGIPYRQIRFDTHELRVWYGRTE
jgi:hypothetical protein